MNNYSNLRTASCSINLSSCRLKAEAIARALNNRIWPNFLLNDCDTQSDEEAPQVTPALKIVRGSRFDSAIDRAPQAHDIYNDQQKVIGHCYVNGMDDDDEYFDTPDSSSIPSPAEEEIIVNPPIQNGVPPFYMGPLYQPQSEVGEGASSLTPKSGQEKIVDGVELYERLRKYSDSLQQSEDLSETFYDISDDEESEIKIACSSDTVSETVTPENIEVAWIEREILQLISETKSNNAGTENLDINSSQNEASLQTKEADDGRSNTDDVSTGISSDCSKCTPAESAGSENEETTSAGSMQSCPSIGIQPASPPLPPAPSDWNPDEAQSSSSNSAPDVQHLNANFRLRRIQELEEEERPKLIRSTSLKTGKTPPGTPGSKKFVRFADALGLDLEAVRHIITDDLPHVPSSAYTDLKLTDDSSEPPSAAIHRIAERSPFDGGSTSNTWDTVVLHGVGSGTLSLYPQFSPPSSRPDFLERVRDQGVCLENIIVSDLSLHCICRVYNVSYAKNVTARYTTNDWQTFEEVAASYVPDSSNGYFDKFSFSLFLPHMQPNARLQFAIRYAVKDREYWDNNAGENYIVGCHENAPILPSTEETSSWMHHFY